MEIYYQNSEVFVQYFFILITQLNGKLGNINVYVGSDGKLHFKNSAGADSALPFNTSVQVLALNHANQNKDLTIYTSDRRIDGLTLIASDTGTNCILKINGVTQIRKHTQALNTGDNFGYMTYDSVLNPGDVVSVRTSAGGGFDVLLLDRILQ